MGNRPVADDRSLLLVAGRIEACLCRRGSTRIADESGHSAMALLQDEGDLALVFRVHIIGRVENDAWAGECGKCLFQYAVESPVVGQGEGLVFNRECEPLFQRGDLDAVAVGFGLGKRHGGDPERKAE